MSTAGSACDSTALLDTDLATAGHVSALCRVAWVCFVQGSSGCILCMVAVGMLCTGCRVAVGVLCEGCRVAVGVLCAG